LGWSGFSSPWWPRFVGRIFIVAKAHKKPVQGRGLRGPRENLIGPLKQKSPGGL
jgi:hypothetical protein